MKYIRICTYIICSVWIILLTACGVDDHNMFNQARYEPYEASKFFDNGASVRPDIPYSIPQDDEQPHLIPEPNTKDWLLYGQEQFNIKCAVCHGQDGYGKGPVVRQGYPSPPSYHTERLRSASDQHIFNVISNGLGKMRPQDRWVDEQTRWAIIDYIRVLQLSQHANINELPEEVVSNLKEAE